MSYFSSSAFSSRIVTTLVSSTELDCEAVGEDVEGGEEIEGDRFVVTDSGGFEALISKAGVGSFCTERASGCIEGFVFSNGVDSSPAPSSVPFCALPISVLSSASTSSATGLSPPCDGDDNSLNGVDCRDALSTADSRAAAAGGAFVVGDECCSGGGVSVDAGDVSKLCSLSLWTDKGRIWD